MKYIVMTILIPMIILITWIVILLHFIWDPIECIKKIKENCTTNGNGKILWFSTLTDPEFYIRMI